MGAAAQVDSSCPKWLHVHVRPPVRGLLKLLKVGGLVMHLLQAVGSVMCMASSWQSIEGRYAIGCCVFFVLCGFLLGPTE